MLEGLNVQFKSTTELINWYDTRIKYYKDNFNKIRASGIMITPGLITTLETRVSQLKSRKL
tara:strand:- start:9405 stop:9587 length:183 start_codon:yes stop_codon:yes gene_type:complete